MSDGEQDERSACPLPHRDEQPRWSWEAAGTILCGGHVRAADKQLDELPGFYDKLAAAHLSSGVAVGYGSRSAEKPLPIKPKITEHRGRIIGVLASWTANVADERGVTDPARYDVVELARFLRRHLAWALQQDWAEDFVTEIAELHRDAKKLIWPDRIDRRTRIPCPQEDCDGMLLTSVDRDEPDDDRLPAALTCDTCGYPVPPSMWRKLARDVHQLDGLVTEEAAVIWALAEWAEGGPRLAGPTLRVWAHRGHISRYRHSDGRWLYDLEEIVCRLEKRVCLIKRGSRPPTPKHAAAA